MSKNVAYFVANPTKVEVEVGGLKIPSGHVAKLTVETEAHVEYVAQLIAKGCVVGQSALSTVLPVGTVAVDSVTNKVVTSVNLVQEGARLLGALERAVVSAGSDAHAAAGV